MATNSVKPPRAWLRLYTEILSDPKVQLLTDKQHRFWINVLCLARQNDGLLYWDSVSQYAWSLRMKEPVFAKRLQELINGGLVDMVSDGVYQPHGWSSRQYESDTSTARVQRHRERQGQRSGNVSVTPPEAETETETETETEAEEKTIPVPAPALNGKGCFMMSDDWRPSPEVWGNIGTKHPTLDRDAALAEFRAYRMSEGKAKTQVSWETDFAADAPRKVAQGKCLMAQAARSDADTNGWSRYKEIK